MEKIFIEHPWIIVLVLIWTLPWKGAALWRAARRGHLGWFFTLLVFNTMAILDIIYIFFFSENTHHENNQDANEVRQAKMQRVRVLTARQQPQELLSDQNLADENTKQLNKKRQTII